MIMKRAVPLIWMAREIASIVMILQQKENMRMPQSHAQSKAGQGHAGFRLVPGIMLQPRPV